MSTAKYIIIGIILLAVVGGYLLWQNPSVVQAPKEETEVLGTGEEAMSESDFKITYTNGGFSPREMTVPAGETVTFVNESSREMWPASAQHPTHTVYPGSDIKKCGTDEASAIFDACSPVSTGAVYTFVFQEVGEWFYHDHLNPSAFGKIIVQ